MKLYRVYTDGTKKLVTIPKMLQLGAGDKFNWYDLGKVLILVPERDIETATTLGEAFTQVIKILRQKFGDGNDAKLRKLFAAALEIM